jgi:glutathione synthase/RimK-type ligase-like ATP-grasp enzyme
MKILIVKDFSSRFDPEDWSAVYARRLSALGIDSCVADLSGVAWVDEVQEVRPDAVLWRVWHRGDDLADATTKIGIMERMGIRCFPSAESLWTYDDKIRQFEIARRLSIPIPRTIVTRRRIEAHQFATEVGFPVVSKIPFGACGGGVGKLADADALHAFLAEVFSENGLATTDPTRRHKGIVLLQEFVPAVRDLRVIVVGRSIERSFWRSGADWRHNVSRGARIEPTTIPPAVAATLLRLTESLRMPWGAFDLIESGRTFLLLEFSTQFGFSSPAQYAAHFGRWEAGILDKQCDYIACELSGALQ